MGINETSRINLINKENLFRLYAFHHNHSENDGLERVNERIINKIESIKRDVLK